MTSHPIAKPNRALMTLVISLLTGCACAQPTGSNDRPPPPPAEAMAACKAAASGAACSFSTPRGELSGTCWAPEGKPLACKPKNAPTPGPNGAQ